MVSSSTACGSANNNLSAIDCMYCGAWSEVSYQQQQQQQKTFSETFYKKYAFDSLANQIYYRNL